MGGSPPFLYSQSFYGPTDRPFNPKAVTQASWTPAPPRPKPKGPLVNFNDHPDSYCNIRGSASRWVPLSPRTKGRVKYGRKIQLALRTLALIGAAGSLFCAAAVKGAGTIIWIIRAGPIVAILHTLYGIYNLCRSMDRPPGSQASYMAFAATFDLGLIPFYAFAAYIGREEYTAGTYNWDTMFHMSGLTHKLAKSIFLLSVVNGGLHLASLGLSVFLAVIYRQISQLPPDLNPLEDNLTARPHKRNKSELIEKHLSNSTVSSGLDDPLLDPPRLVPFMHTRGMSSGGGSSQFSSDRSLDSPVPQVPLHQNYSPRPDTKPGVRFRPLMSQPNVQISETPVQNLNNVFARPSSAMLQDDPVWDPSAIPERSQCLSPDSDNWVTYPEQSPSPVSDGHPPVDDVLLPEEDLPKKTLESRTPSSISSNSGFRNWLNYSQRYGRDVGAPIAEDARGEYESLATHGYYANEEDMSTSLQSTSYNNLDNGQDMGDRNQINIHLDEPVQEETQHSLPMNPLGMNPPTPQPTPDSTRSRPTSIARAALTDIPNLSPNHAAIASGRKSGLYTSSGDTCPGREEEPSVTQKSGVPQTKTRKSATKMQKSKAYSTLKQYDLDSDEDATVTTGATTREGDRQGRVVSNSGADIATKRIPVLGSSLSYGNYIAGLGVGLGRRRDVSGKIAEEGRSGDSPAPAADNKTRSESTTPIRAAGWARFAGL